MDRVEAKSHYPATKEGMLEAVTEEAVAMAE
jgi:hypothetical protein